MLVTALVVAAATGCSSHGAPPAPSVHRAERPAQRIDARGPVGLTAVGSTVWTVEAAAGAVVARDARTGRLLHRVHVGATPLRAVYDGTSLWVSVFGAGKVVAVDPSSGRIVHRVRMSGQPEGITAAFGAIWVVRQAARKLTRISPAGRVGPSYRLGAEPRLVAASAHDLFVADVTDGTITRVDPNSGRRTVSGKVCDGAQDVVDAGGTLWVACTRSNRVVGVDENTLRVTASLHVAGEPDGERVHSGTLYVVATTGPTIYRVRIGTDPAIEHKQDLGKAFALDDRANVDLVVASGRIWVSSYGEGKVLNIPA
jgi:outer membrane protein assembly factor BamB